MSRHFARPLSRSIRIDERMEWRAARPSAAGAVPVYAMMAPVHPTANGGAASGTYPSSRV
jgi:hypothetical protein